MSLKLRWVSEPDYDRVAETRLRCYAPAAKELDNFKAGMLADQRAVAGDFLLAEQDGQAIGTTTALSMHMWVRGARLACQGVAYVGTIRTARRGGVANQLMFETVRKAREREQVVTALMPFRASFYERFGYGIAERRVDWTVPLSLVVPVDTAGLRYATDADRPAVAALRQRFVERGQCDIETTEAGWSIRRRKEPDGFQIVDEDGGAWAFCVSDMRDGARPILRIEQAAWDKPGHLLKLLSFLGGQRDQFTLGWISLPGDLPLNRVLKESQLPHRPVPHAFAQSQPYTRMQIRVLDHKRFLEALHLPKSCGGSCTIEIVETEGDSRRLKIDASEGRITTQPHAGDCDVTCTDRVWASIISGDLPARTAAMLGLLRTSSPQAIDLLGVFGDGPAPFCSEYF